MSESSEAIKKEKNKYLIDISKFNVIKNLGPVKIATDEKTDQNYAMKESFYTYNSQHRLYIIREISNLINIIHPTIVKVVGFSLESMYGENKLTILMNYNNGISLAKLLEKELNYSYQDYEDRKLVDKYNNNTNRQIILVGIARAMMLIHECHIVHCNLNPANIFLDDNFHPQITDYGLSKLFNPDNLIQSNRYPRKSAYLAPEVIIKNRFSQKSDVYSFGVIMYEVISKSQAFNKYFNSNSFNLQKFKEKVADGKIKLFINFPCKEGIKKMIEACLSFDPNERPTFQEIFNKLSMSEVGNFMNINEDHYKPVLNYNESYSYTDYCLDEVDEEEFGMYLIDILDEVSSANKDRKEFTNLKNKVEEMKTPVSQIPILLEKYSKIKEEIKQIEDEMQKEADQESDKENS